jgi:hypothetical protein
VHRAIVPSRLGAELGSRSTGLRPINAATQLAMGRRVLGLTDACLFMKRARVLQELFGDAAFHADRAALLSGY